MGSLQETPELLRMLGILVEKKRLTEIKHATVIVRDV
jgi:hypothetical protein